MIDTTTDQNAYDQGVKNFSQGMTDLTNGQNNQVTATRATFDPTIKSLQDQIATFDTQIQGIKGTLNNLPANVVARGNGMGSDAQLSRQTTAEAAPLQTNLANLGLAESPLASSLSTTQGNETSALSALNDKFARETTGYTTTAQATLNGLLDKLTNDRTLNATEMQQTYDLAKLDKQYQQALSLAKANAPGNNPYLPNGGATTNASIPGVDGSTGALQRVSGTNNVTAGGWSGTREEAAARMAQTSDTNSAAWQAAYKQILQEFPSTNQATNTPPAGTVTDPATAAALRQLSARSLNLGF